ncbi:MAG: hypothetical protein IKD93_02550 [Firmicutes bacterium]|nr:hypothetical protein [Bacillota bacterium]
MIYPILFEHTATVFTSNGLGRLSDCLSCTVTEELNGGYELELTCPVMGRHFNEVALSRILLVRVADGSRQPFRIYATSRPIDGKVTVRARHISYDLTKVTVLPFSKSAAAGGVFDYMKGLSTPRPAYTFWTDITGSATVATEVPASFRALLGDSGQQSMVNGFLGELEWDVFQVKLHEERGQDRHVSIRYGKNMTDVQADLEADLYNTVIPYAKGTDDQIIVGSPVTYDPSGPTPVLGTPLKILSHPANKTASAGSTATFGVTAEGDGLTYQWQYKTGTGTGWTNNSSFVGATSPILEVPVTSARNGYQFRCKVTDERGNVVYSNPGTLISGTAPLTITAQPQDYSGATGSTAHFTVTATGTGLTYQWWYKAAGDDSFSQSTATSGTTADYSVTATAAREGFQVFCQIKNSGNKILQTDTATLHLNDLPQERAGVVPLDVSDQFDTTDGATPSRSGVTAAGLRWMQKNKPWQAIREITVSFVSGPGDNYTALRKVLMGDTVLVHHEELGVSERLRVVRTVWDCLRERYEELGIGDPLRLLSERLRTAQQQTNKKINKAQDTAQHVANGTYSGGSMISGQTVSNADIVGGTLSVGPISGSSPQDHNFKVDASGNVEMSGNIDLKGSVRAFGNFTVLKKADISSDNPQPVGHMGEAFGDDGSGSESKGVALAYASDPNDLDDDTDCFVICTPNGVRMQCKGHNLYVTASGAFADGEEIATVSGVQNAIAAAAAAQNNGGS